VNAIAAAREMLRAVGASNVGNAWPIRLGIDNYIGQEVTGTVGSPRREEYAAAGFGADSGPSRRGPL
jgi:adenylate cyclase